MKSIHEYKRAFITASNVILVCLFALFLSPSYLHAQVNYSTYPYCSPTTFVQTDVGGTTGGSGTNFGKGPTQYTKSALMACGYINSEITSDHYAALNTQDYAAAQGCGACALVMNGSHATTVMVVDECPSSSNMPCVNGTHHIDLGNGAYSDLQVSYPNPVSWCLVACPAALRNIDNGTGNISYEYKSASAGNAGWHPIHFLDMLYPLVSVSVGTSSGGPFSALSRDSGTDNIPNYWGGKAGQPDNSTGPFWYVLKDGPGNSVTINVGSISPSESTVPYGAGGVQFPANCSTGPTNTFTKTPTVGSPTNTPTRTFTVTPTPTFTPLSGCKYNIYDGDTGTTNLAAGSTFGTNVTITESTTTPHSGTDSMQLAFNWPSGYFAGMGWNWAKYAAASPKILNINNFTELEFWIRATTGAPVTNMTVTLADYGGAGAGGVTASLPVTLSPTYLPGGATSTWQVVDIPISAFNTGGASWDKTKVGEIDFSTGIGMPSGTQTVFIDDFGFYGTCPTNTPTATNTPPYTATFTFTKTFTATNTLTSTNTPTATSTKTNTPTFTATNSPTNTPMFTSTFTNTPTKTPTNTPTNTLTFTATNTPTRTFTPTNTSTNTPTRTSTNTPTATNTPANTSTFTSTSTSTPTRTFTSTSTPTLTFTATNSPTRTFTLTSTNTPVNTFTPTSTATNSPTRTATNSFTATPTKTNTPTSTITNTPTNSLTPTMTFTGTQPPTNTFTNTFTRTNTATSTNTPTNTASSTRTATSTSTSTPTNTSANTSTRTMTFTPTNTSALTSTFTPTLTSTATPTNSFTRTFTPTSTFSNTATRTFTPSFTSTATFTLTSTHTPTITGTPTNTVTGTQPPTNTFTNTGTFTHTPTNTATLTVTNTLTMTRTFTFTSTHTPTNSPANTLTNTPTLTSTKTFTNTPANTSTSTFTNTPTNTFSPTITFTGTQPPTNTFTNTLTRTNTATSTHTPTNTATSTFTASFTKTNTPTSTNTTTNTVMPTATWATVSLSVGTSEPGNSTQTSGSSNVPVLQIHASNQSNAPTTLTSLKLTASGSANDASGISGVSLYLDANNDGVLDNGDSLLSTGTYPLDNGVLTLNFTSGIGAFGTANYLVAYNFSGSAPAGTYQANVVGNSDVTGVNGATGQPVVVTGAPLGGAVITIVQVTATPTSTSTPANTSTPTITSTPTPQTHSVIHIPYPNPVENGPVEVDLEIPGTERVQWSVFTLSFRKILGGEKSITGTGSIEWDLTDKSGSRVADGLYYLRLEVSGIQPTVKIFKIIVLR